MINCGVVVIRSLRYLGGREMVDHNVERDRNLYQTSRSLEKNRFFSPVRISLL